MSVCTLDILSVDDEADGGGFVMLSIGGTFSVPMEYLVHGDLRSPPLQTEKKL